MALKNSFFLLFAINSMRVSKKEVKDMAKRVFAFVFAVALLTANILPAFAKTVYQQRNLYRSWSDDYQRVHMYYDIGSTWPYDDVNAETHVTVYGNGGGEWGAAYVRVTCSDGTSRSDWETSVCQYNIMATNTVTVPGHDYASQVNYYGNVQKPMGSIQNVWDIYVTSSV